MKTNYWNENIDKWVYDHPPPSCANKLNSSNPSWVKVSIEGNSYWGHRLKISEKAATIGKIAFVFSTSILFAPICIPLYFLTDTYRFTGKWIRQIHTDNTLDYVEDNDRKPDAGHNVVIINDIVKKLINDTSFGSSQETLMMLNTWALVDKERSKLAKQEKIRRLNSGELSFGDFSKIKTGEDLVRFIHLYEKNSFTRLDISKFNKITKTQIKLIIDHCSELKFFKAGCPINLNLLFPLKNLKELDLRYGFTSDKTEIEKTINLFSNLTYLALSSENFNQIDQSIFKKPPSLEVLKIYGETAIEDRLDNLKNLTKLKELYIEPMLDQINKISNKNLKKLHITTDPRLCDINHLTELEELSIIIQTPTGADERERFNFPTLNKLKKLNLEYAKDTFFTITNFSEAVPLIEEIDFRISSNFGFIQVDELPKTVTSVTFQCRNPSKFIEKQNTIQNLDNLTRISDYSGALLPYLNKDQRKKIQFLETYLINSEELKLFTNLKELHVQNIFYTPNSALRLENLYTLSIHNLYIRSPERSKLPPFECFPNLENLTVYTRKDLPPDLFLPLEKLKKLSILTFEEKNPNNKIVTISDWPNDPKNFKNLEHLDIKYCTAVPNEIPHFKYPKLNLITVSVYDSNRDAMFTPYQFNSF